MCRPLRWIVGAIDREPALPRPLVQAYLARGGSERRAAAFLASARRRSARLGVALTQEVAEHRRADFQTGNTLLLDGWIVAESEVLFVTGLDPAVRPAA